MLLFCLFLEKIAVTSYCISKWGLWYHECSIRSFRPTVGWSNCELVHQQKKKKIMHLSLFKMKTAGNCGLILAPPSPWKAPTSSSLIVPAFTRTHIHLAAVWLKVELSAHYWSSYRPIHLLHQESLSFHQSKNPGKICLQIFLGPVWMLQLMCLVHWWSSLAFSTLTCLLSTEHIVVLGNGIAQNLKVIGSW